MRSITIFLLAIFIWVGCKRHSENYEAVLPSPGLEVHLHVNLFNGIPYYLVYYKEYKIINWSLLGFAPADKPPLAENMVYVGGITEDIGLSEGSPEFFKELKYNSLSIDLVSGKHPDMGYSIDFRTFSNGFAFRYRFNSREDMDLMMKEEVSEFIFENDDHNWTTSSGFDTLQGPAGLYNVPLELFSAQRLGASILEVGVEPSAPMKLMLGEEPASFRVKVGSDPSSNPHLEKETATAWRVVQISINESDE